MAQPALTGPNIGLGQFAIAATGAWVAVRLEGRMSVGEAQGSLMSQFGCTAAAVSAFFAALDTELA